MDVSFFVQKVGVAVVNKPRLEDVECEISCLYYDGYYKGGPIFVMKFNEVDVVARDVVYCLVLVNSEELPLR